MRGAALVPSPACGGGSGKGRVGVTNDGGGNADAIGAAGCMALSLPSPASGGGMPSAGERPPASTATTAPTGTASPAPTRISVSTPAAVAGTSIATLSVSISNKLSPGLTASPIDLNQVVILPSVTVSPSCGMRMSNDRGRSTEDG